MHTVMDTVPPAHWHFRDGTHDREIWRCVVECDEYRMSEREFAPDDVIVDVGAHIGSFTWLAKQRGSSTVYSFEPCRQNYLLLGLNVGTRQFNQALWRSDGQRYGSLYFQPSTNQENTGGGDVLYEFGTTVDFMSLDWFIERHNIKRIRLLKLDCESSEYPILLTSKHLGICDEIIGEYHELPYGGRSIPSFARVGGVREFSRDVLRGCLERNGFEVEMCHEAENIGKFFARRV